MIPIVYLQRGWFPHFELAVRSARHLHPGNEIVHIGDRRYRALGDDCDFVNLADVSISKWNLKDHYQHRSPNTIQFELFCLERWFYLLELMKKRDWETCWVFDSDTLLFANFDILARSYESFGITINKYSPHATLIGRRQSLESFCHWVLDVYQRPELLEKRTADLGWGVPGISDMTLLTQFGQEVEPIGDNSQPTEFGLIDNNISMPQGVLYAEGQKVICRRRGVPYVEDNAGNLIALNLIHFQGPAKRRMPEFSDLGRDPVTRRLARWTTEQQFALDRRWQRLNHSLTKRLSGFRKSA